jgi:hypothetical protein
VLLKAAAVAPSALQTSQAVRSVGTLLQGGLCNVGLIMMGGLVCCLEQRSSIAAGSADSAMAAAMQ